MFFSERLKALRQVLGLTRAQLSEKSGICVRTIESYERENVTPSIYMAYDLCHSLGVSLDDFLNPDINIYALVSELC